MTGFIQNSFSNPMWNIHYVHFNKFSVFTIGAILFLPL